jgi:LysM repeat protein
MMQHVSTTKDPVETVVYQVQPDDSLSAIVQRYFGRQASAQTRALLQQVVAENPHIKNANLIYPGQFIKLNVPLQYCPAPDSYMTPTFGFDGNQDWFSPLQSNWVTASKDEKSMQLALAKFMLGSGAANLAMVDRTFKSNSPLLREMVENYEAYKRGDVTKGQYDYRRSKLVRELDANLGPTSRLLNGRRGSSEVLRVSRRANTVPTEPIMQQINKMNRLSRVASRGGVALSVVGLGIACHEIAQADTAKKKNEILMESLGALSGGALYGLGVGFAAVFFATPAGWVAALALGVGGVLVGYGSGKAAKSLYNTSGTKIDLVESLGVSGLCSPGAGLKAAYHQASHEVLMKAPPLKTGIF